MDKSTISARIDTDILTKLDGLSKATARSKSYLIAQAIGNYVEDQAWQIEAIKEGVKDFRTLMNLDIKYVSPGSDFFEAVNTLFRAGTNVWVNSKVYNLYPEKDESLEDNLARAVEEFEKFSS